MEFSAKCLSPVCGHSNRRDRMTRMTTMRVTTSHSHAMRAALVLVVVHMCAAQCARVALGAGLQLRGYLHVLADLFLCITFKLHCK